MPNRRLLLHMNRCSQEFHAFSGRHHRIYVFCCRSRESICMGKDFNANRQTLVKETLARIVYTHNLEEELSVGTSYRDSFTEFELRRTEISCAAFAG